MTEAALTPGTRADCGTDGQVRPAQVSPDTGQQLLSARVRARGQPVL